MLATQLKYDLLMFTREIYYLVFTVVVLYFILAFGIGWVPFEWSCFFSAIVLFAGFYLIFWTAFNLYFRNQAKKLNDELDLL